MRRPTSSLPNPPTYRKISLIFTLKGGNLQMETEQISLDDILSIESDDQMVQQLASSIGFRSCKKDPSGGRFYYLTQAEADIRPIAVGLFDELKGNDKQALKAKLTDRKTALYREIYSHYLDRHLEQQPALYILLPKDHKRGLMTLIKPTDSGLKVRDQLILDIPGRDAEIKLALLKKSHPLNGLFFQTPSIDHLFYDPVGTAKELATELARITRNMEQVIVKLYEQETEKDFLHQLHKSFKAELLPHLKLTSSDPKEYGFADLYAQTISYGMFTGRCFKPTQTFERRYVSKWNIPPTNPFLKNLFESISDQTQAQQVFYAPLFDLIEDLVGCLSSTDMEAILTDFSYDKTHHEDIVIHFYETFLQAYNPKQREIRGVYYTPYPVVSYIVRSVDIILKEKFNKPLGLADPEVLILDPATGTGTFLFAIFKHLEEFYKTQVAKTGAISWDNFIDQNILPRLFGFELMMAPYAVAHLRLGVELQESGYKFRDDTQRLGVYLTNTLDETAKKSETFFEEFIASESNEAAEIKREKPIMVIMGNPPYSGHSANTGEWISKLMRGTDTLNLDAPNTENYFNVDGQPLGERNPKWLNDDYVKFIRFAQWRVDKTGQGIVAFITNHGYLDNPTFRGMRESLLKSFDKLYILDLHGNKKKQEICPDGSVDENVFDIQQGVSIGILVKTGQKARDSLGQVYHFDLWGLREFDRTSGKYPWLLSEGVSTTNWQPLLSRSPNYYFASSEQITKDLEAEYELGFSLTDIFALKGSGFRTHRDHLAIAFEPNELQKRFETLISSSLSELDKRALYSIEDNRDWNLRSALSQLKQLISTDLPILNCLYRPFDSRFVFYGTYLMDYPSEREQRHLSEANLALCIGRQGQAVSNFWDLAFVTSQLTDNNLFRRGGIQFFPAYTYPNNDNLLEINLKGPSSNIKGSFINALIERTGFSVLNSGEGDFENSIGPEGLLYYIYSILYSPLFRVRYAEFLKRDFPRIPFTTNQTLFKALLRLGRKLTQVHLMQAEINLQCVFPINGSNKIERHTYSAQQQRVWINKTQYFEVISQDVWDFHIGGFQICEKWLKDRKKADRSLSDEDILHYRKIVATLQETIVLMAEIDETIESHGGWPLQ